MAILRGGLVESADPEQPAVSIIRPAHAASLHAAELTEEIIGGDNPDGASLHTERACNELIEINARWHIAVAISTQNPLVTQVMSATESTLPSSVLTEFSRSYLGDDSIWTITPTPHRTATHAITKNDIDTPIRRLGRHVHSYANLVTKRTEKTPDLVLFYFATAEHQRSTTVNIHPTRSGVARAQPERHIPI